MSAAVLPFPILRRSGFVQRQAARAAQMNPQSGATYLDYQVEIQRATMRKKGISEDLIEREIRCMALALQAAFQTAVQTGGDR